MAKVIGGEFLKYPSVMEQNRGVDANLGAADFIYRDRLRVEAGSLARAIVDSRLRLRRAPLSVAEEVLGKK